MKKCCQEAAESAAQEAAATERETLSAWLRNRARELIDPVDAEEERRDASWREGYDDGKDSGDEAAREDLYEELFDALGLQRGGNWPTWEMLLEKVREACAARDRHKKEFSLLREATEAIAAAGRRADDAAR